MAILHLVGSHLSSEAIEKLAQRSHVDDAFVFMDDGVYVCLTLPHPSLGGRELYLMAEHAEQRGLIDITKAAVTNIDMLDLVNLTARYASSMSW